MNSKEQQTSRWTELQITLNGLDAQFRPNACIMQKIGTEGANPAWLRDPPELMVLIISKKYLDIYSYWGTSHFWAAACERGGWALWWQWESSDHQSWWFLSKPSCALDYSRNQCHLSWWCAVSTLCHLMPHPVLQLCHLFAITPPCAPLQVCKYG